MPTHYQEKVDVDGDGHKNDMILGYDNNRTKEFYIHNHTGFKRSDLHSISVRDSGLEEATKFHNSQLKKSRESTTNIKNRLRKAQGNSK